MKKKKGKKKHRNYVALAAHFRNGGYMDSRPNKTRRSQKESAIRDQE